MSTERADRSPDPTAFAERSGSQEAHLHEQLLDSQSVYAGRFLQVYSDRVRLSNGVESGREFIRHPGAVMVVPCLDDGRFVMERQYRHPLGRVLLEFPAGKIDPGEPVWKTAERELREETGFRAREWARAGHLHNAPAYSDEAIEVWFARGLEQGAAAPDADELLDVGFVDLETLLRLSAQGELTDAKTLIGLHWIEHWRAGRWAPAWGLLEGWATAAAAPVRTP